MLSKRISNEISMIRYNKKEGTIRAITTLKQGSLAKLPESFLRYSYVSDISVFAVTFHSVETLIVLRYTSNEIKIIAIHMLSKVKCRSNVSKINKSIR